MTKESNRRKAKNKKGPNRVDIREEKDGQEPRRRSLNESY